MGRMTFDRSLRLAPADGGELSTEKGFLFHPFISPLIYYGPGFITVFP